MKRQGRYTKKPSTHARSRYFVRRKWQDFKSLSRRKKMLYIGGPILAFLILTPIVTYALLYRDISDSERLMNRSNTGIQLTDKNGEVFFSTGSNKALKRLKLDDISDYTEKALISSEDKSFYEHSGISIRGILGAFKNQLTGSDGGGSTLTQQLVKNTLLSNENRLLRKYQEVFMAIAVENRYSKDEVLDMYLNSVYFGEGAFGIDEAAKTYFGKSARDLDLAESAMLVGLLPAPGSYSPISGNAKYAKDRQSYVLKRMVADGKITKADKDAALAQQLSYAEVKEVSYPNAPHFAEMVLAELNKKYGDEKIKRSGYKVQTTLDISWQKQAEDIVARNVARSAAGGGRNAAVVAIDPKTGEVRALVGSVDYNEPTFGKVNMATSARQPGSSFKPIYVTEALNQKLVTAATILRDEATDFGNYKPNNYDFKFRGDITLRNGLAQSLNIPALKVLQKLGVDEAVAKAREMGISTIDPNKNYGMSLGLGSAEARPIDMTNAYAAFANGGRQYERSIISSIKNKYGETIYKSNPKSKRVQSQEASFVISDILSDNTARAPSFGSRLNIPGRKVAVKTGSTDDNRDAWTIGFTPSVTVGVWVGNNENEVMTSGGSAMAGPIWSQSIQAFLDGTPVEQFSQPGGVYKTWACKPGGGGYEEFFINGTQPDKSCKPEEKKDTDRDGVADDVDQCVTTPAGSTPDPAKPGCPKKEEADTTKPVISGASNTGIPVGSSFDPMSGVTATDNKDGDITSRVAHSGTVNTAVPGTYPVTYTVSDAAGNVTTVTRTITVTTTDPTTDPGTGTGTGTGGGTPTP